MDPVRQGSREGSVGSSSSGQSSQIILLNEQVELLRREIELLKATISRSSHVAPYPDHASRALQIEEQMEQLRLEKDRLLASRLAPSGSAMSPRTYQDAYRGGMQQAGASQADLYAYRNDQYQAPVSPDSMYSSHKYVIEAPFATKAVSSSKRLRSRSLPKPSAPSGASTRSLTYSRSIQVDRDEGNPRREDPGNYMPPSSPGLSPRSLQDFGEQSKSMSPQTLHALGTLYLLRQEKEKLEAELSLRTRAQMNNNPVSAGPDTSPRTLQALDEVARVKREIEMLKANKVELPAISQRTRQVMDQLEKVRRENEMLKSSKAKEMESAQRRLAYFEQNHAAASKARMLDIKKMLITSQELDLAFLVDATGSMQVLSCTLRCLAQVLDCASANSWEAFPGTFEGVDRDFSVVDKAKTQTRRS
jgi:hypothetical protein